MIHKNNNYASTVLLPALLQIKD